MAEDKKKGEGVSLGKTPWIFLGVMIFGGLLLAFIINPPDSPDVDRTPDPASLKNLETLAKEADCTLTHPAESGFDNHSEDPVTYDSIPPTSGTHASQAAPAGDHTDSEAPPREEQVHALEHGYIIFYSKTPDPDLQELRAAEPELTLLVVDSEIPEPYAATAWGHLITCPSGKKSLEALTSFRETYLNRGPEKLRE